MAIRDIGASDFDWVLELNERFQVETSSLTLQRLAELAAAASWFRVADGRAAFLLAFDQEAAYDGACFLWHRKRCSRFLYVDRIIVQPSARGRGLARRLYEDLFGHARGAGHDAITCEINSDPPNPASDAFHAAMGFEGVGEERLEGRGKTVRYLRCDLGNR